MIEDKPAISARTIQRYQRQVQEIEGDSVGSLGRVRRFRPQKGLLVEYKDGVYVRYYDGDPDPVTGVRKKIAVRLCDLDADALERNVRLKEHMKRVNAGCRQEVAAAHDNRETADITVGRFFEKFYRPYMYSKEAQLRESTIDTNEHQWKIYCADWFADKSLSSFDANDGRAFLESLVAKDLGRSLVTRVRALCSVVFSYAVRRKKIDSNPWASVGAFVVKKGPVEPREYTVAERDAILALRELSTDAKAFFALCSVPGLRPGEAAGMEWERVDFAKGVMLVSKSVSKRGKLGPLKTENSLRTLAITEPLLTWFKAWHKECGSPTSGLCFKRTTGPNRGSVIKHGEYVTYHLKGVIDEHNKKHPTAKVAWKGCYAGRHLAHKELWNATHNILLVTKVSGNTDMMAFKKYLRASPEEAMDAQRLVEKAQNGKRKKR